MVMGVMSILLAIVLPTIGTAHTAALRKQAETEATALAQAALRYKTEYGFWPGELVINTGSDTVRFHDDFTSSAGDGILALIVSAPQSFLNTLNTHEANGSGLSSLLKLKTNEVCRAFAQVDLAQSGTRKTNPLNPKGIHFLDLTDEGDLNRVSYPDPWGRSYVLFMGMNPQSTFTHEITSESSLVARITISNLTVFAFSFGPLGLNSTNYIYSTGARK